MGNFVTIKEATFQNDLTVAKTFLEDNGIKCLLNTNEYFAQITSKGFQLQVDEDDAEQAIKLLIDGGFASLEEYKELSSDPLTDFVYKIISKLSGE